jgi:hypothetical protein
MKDYDKEAKYLNRPSKTQMSELKKKKKKKQRIKRKTDRWSRGGWASFGGRRPPNRVRLREIGRMVGGGTGGGGYAAWLLFGAAWVGEGEGKSFRGERGKKMKMEK